MSSYDTHFGYWSSMLDDLIECVDSDLIRKVLEQFMQPDATVGENENSYKFREEIRYARDCNACAKTFTSLKI